MIVSFPFEGREAPSGQKDSARQSKAPLLPAPKAAVADSGRASGDLGFLNLSELLHGAVSAFASSLTALSNSANALFAQVAAALALDRVTRDAAAYINAAFKGFGAAPAPQPLFGLPSFSQQGFMLPWAMNPWAAFAEGLNFWMKMWMPQASQPNPPSGQPIPSAFKTRVSTPGSFTWAFSLND
jgi:hypothetical protein